MENPLLRRWLPSLVGLFIANTGLGPALAAASTCKGLFGATESLRRVSGFQWPFMERPINDGPRLIQIPGYEFPLVVFRSSVVSLSIVRNLGLASTHANTYRLFTPPEGYVIRGSRVTEGALFLHLESSGEGRPQHRIYGAAASEGKLVFRQVEIPNPPREWHIESFVKELRADREVEAIARARAASASYGGRGYDIEASTSRSGETTDVVLIRDVSPALPSVKNLEELKEAMSNSRNLISWVRVTADGVASELRQVQLPGTFEKAAIFDRRNPRRVLLLREISGTGYQDRRTSRGDLELVEVDFLEARELQHSRGRSED